jgi:hypothetical protein
MPAGFQRPGVPGAGNVLDPAVRAQIREKLHPVLHEVLELVMGRRDGEAERPEPAAAPEGPAEADRPAPHRAGPFPHGDVDLRYIAANVPPEPVRPQRAGGQRRFYFLQEELADRPAPAGPPTPAGPRPG